ncbi:MULTISPECIES: hypothetical protein [Exiguobacterium]|uniref:Uncharacterized protein n=1 Tax=Exiguobacterium antarcticum TaxID=132920 RepID=A0ABT6R2F2_9BACL|nr:MULTISPECIES: hypothetical protein [Exiguobacterium]MCT4780879.1 hypothetical protein [Exiguobacterium soli]MDI3234993.1 hypothetical protein [Exiguobacterium antarcticum]OIN66053.1 hypothetical protein BLD48_12640 [Exiguobacterium sp. KRL4]
MSQLVVFTPLFLLVLLTYVIISLVDMWRSYTRTSASTDFVFFIVTLVSLFVGFVLSPVLSLVFQWKRSRIKRIIGLIIVGLPFVLFLTDRFF